MLFNADGTYEEGAVINSTQYNCTIKLLGRATGTFAVSGGTLTTYQQEGLTQVTNTCSGVGENVLGPETKEYGWSVGQDENGNQALFLTLPDGSLYGTFYPWGE